MDKYYAKSLANTLGINTDDEKEIDLNFTLKTRKKKNIYEDVFPESDGEIDLGPSYLKVNFRNQDRLEHLIPLSNILLSYKDKIE